MDSAIPQLEIVKLYQAINRLFQTNHKPLLGYTANPFYQIRSLYLTVFQLITMWGGCDIEL